MFSFPREQEHYPLPQLVILYDPVQTIFSDFD